VEPKTAGGLRIREAEAEDEPGVLAIARELLRDGTTYALPEDPSDAALRAYWLSPGGATFVAVLDGAVAGCYRLRPNHPGRGSHVANAGYAVAARFQGRGLGRALAEHSLEEARRRGYRAMQFNLVVSTNERAVVLWRRLGFQVAGALPRVFDHPTRGLVDAFVMHRFL
jgi:ribosomal protein S18 acetylase RimI-like enzyme